MSSATQPAESFPALAIHPLDAATFGAHFESLRDRLPGKDIFVLMREAVARTNADKKLMGGVSGEEAVRLTQDELCRSADLVGLDATKFEYVRALASQTGVALDLSTFTLPEMCELIEHYLLGRQQDHDAPLSVVIKVAYDAVIIGRKANQTAPADESLIAGAAKTVAADEARGAVNRELPGFIFNFEPDKFLRDLADRAEAAKRAPAPNDQTDAMAYYFGVDRAADDGNGEIEEAAGDIPQQQQSSPADVHVEDASEDGNVVSLTVPQWAEQIATDISHEAMRTYVYASETGDDETVTIDSPQFYFEDADGNHCLADAEGDGTIVPAGWLAIEITPKPGKFAFGV